ncbi:MAG: hypothetical protein CK534_02965 [Nitrospirae bacterium]|nr:MAG: hypothetical protein CK534_02965 [Nitrospirota bacterium]
MIAIKMLFIVCNPFLVVEFCAIPRHLLMYSASLVPNHVHLAIINGINKLRALSDMFTYGFAADFLGQNG